MLCVLLLVFLYGHASAVFIKEDPKVHIAFNEFKTKFNKVYTAEEERERLEVFRSNLDLVDELNRREGNTIYGVTKFMDLTPEEFRAAYLLPKGTLSKEKKQNVPYVNFNTENIQVPEAFDWRSKNAVTPAKDQGQCGSCWAFSATEAIESAWFLAGNPLPSLAPQQIVDCDKVDQGCNGGDTPTAYKYVIEAGGMESEKDYPYEGVDQTCAFNKTNVVASIDSWSYITTNKNETEMVQKLYALGPLSICVDASTWQFYFGGVVEHLCYEELDHCVMVTGYNDRYDWLDRKIAVWNIRNSWGTDWGYDGYLYVERNENLCGVADEVTIPLVKKKL
eukprot:TRINITY_DN407_c0_g2_i1.p3 TRINITY_DN407_c0_g2~~TRINITY_DN407_c0_g2_i1.p3  ORF type:complete len:335 (+),score=98.25 TRINITY_DN407_c0_g2_i1:1018-2022(+)